MARMLILSRTGACSTSHRVTERLKYEDLRDQIRRWLQDRRCQSFCFFVSLVACGACFATWIWAIGKSQEQCFFSFMWAHINKQSLFLLHTDGPTVGSKAQETMLASTVLPHSLKIAHLSFGTSDLVGNRDVL